MEQKLITLNDIRTGTLDPGEYRVEQQEITGLKINPTHSKGVSIDFSNSLFRGPLALDYSNDWRLKNFRLTSKEVGIVLTDEVNGLWLEQVNLFEIGSQGVKISGGTKTKFPKRIRFFNGSIDKAGQSASSGDTFNIHRVVSMNEAYTEDVQIANSVFSNTGGEGECLGFSSEHAKNILVYKVKADKNSKVGHGISNVTFYECNMDVIHSKYSPNFTVFGGSANVIELVKQGGINAGKVSTGVKIDKRFESIVKNNQGAKISFITSLEIPVLDLWDNQETPPIVIDPPIEVEPPIIIPPVTSLDRQFLLNLQNQINSYLK